MYHHACFEFFTRNFLYPLSRTIFQSSKIEIHPHTRSLWHRKCHLAPSPWENLSLHSLLTLSPLPYSRLGVGRGSLSELIGLPVLPCMYSTTRKGSHRTGSSWKSRVHGSMGKSYLREEEGNFGGGRTIFQASRNPKFHCSLVPSYHYPKNKNLYTKIYCGKGKISNNFIHTCYHINYGIVKHCMYIFRSTPIKCP